MNEPSAPSISDPLLDALGIPHGFGQRGSAAPPDTCFPTQVHGVEVYEHLPAESCRVDADALFTRSPGATVGVVTADCVPILVARRSGEAVAAIHAGWRGLAAGVIEAGVAAIAVEGEVAECVAAIGPSARGCCYEVDAPVREGLADRYADLLGGVMQLGRPGRFQLDLPELAACVLQSLGFERSGIGTFARICTICSPDRFDSYRRDGAAAGRLRHYITRPRSPLHQG